MPDYMQLFPKGIQWLQFKKQKIKQKQKHTSFQKFKFIDVNINFRNFYIFTDYITTWTVIMSSPQQLKKALKKCKRFSLKFHYWHNYVQ